MELLQDALEPAKSGQPPEGHAPEMIIAKLVDVFVADVIK